jgi:hypothetical protein
MLMKNYLKCQDRGFLVVVVVEEAAIEEVCFNFDILLFKIIVLFI